ncbi:MAG: hypothetical protein V2A74_04860, partial [bacterium]
GAGLPARADGDPALPSVEIIYIPQEDISRAPGFSQQGVFLPLSDLMALAKGAERIREGEAREASVFCTGLELGGELAESLELKGDLAFEARGKGWSAALVDDGAMPWVGQENAGGNSAFLARVNGRTFLFAQGPAKGTVRVHALLATPMRNSGGEIRFGRIFAPCRIRIALRNEWEVVSATVPLERRSDSSGDSISIWPTKEDAAQLNVKRVVTKEFPSSLRVFVTRNVGVGESGLEVQDEITLEDQFTSGSRIRLPLPPGLRLLKATANFNVEIKQEESALLLSPREKMELIHVRASFAAEMTNGTAALSGWSFPDAISEMSSLNLQDQGDHYLMLSPAPPSLTRADTQAGWARSYSCRGALPTLNVSLLPKQPELPPKIFASLVIGRNEATARYDIHLKSSGQTGMVIRVPKDWVFQNLELIRGSETPPFALQQEKEGQWRVTWIWQGPPNTIKLTLHRGGAWGAPGVESPLALPVIEVDWPRPTQYEFSILWPEDLDVRMAELSDLAVVPTGELAQPDAGAKLGARVVGEAASGTLLIKGRESDVQATVVTALSLWEDRATVKSLISYAVRFAPINTFRFVLPAGTGSAVRIDGEGVRETTLHSSERGDEWTVVTQDSISGAFALTLEWALAAKPAKEAIRAPEIRADGVTAQRGFLILEGSETLRLTTEARNLAETDLSEVPTLPWKHENRVLAAYRYVAPPYMLEVKAEKFKAESPVEAIAREAALTTTVGRDGVRLTQAVYSVAPMSDRQFFEVRLPEGAQ